MPKSVVIDELYLTVRIPSNLSDTRAEAVRRTLAGADFTDRVRRAVRAAVRTFPELVRVRVSLSR